MKVLLTCGGTGGHITPALAIAEALRAESAAHEIRFVGTEGGMETELVMAAGYPITGLAVRGFSGRSPRDLLAASRLLRAAVKEAGKMIKEFAPDIVIGTGSYACYPTCRAAILAGVPVAVHESNAVPGLAVKMLSRRLSRVWLNFEEAARGLPHSAKVLTVGNPVVTAAAPKKAGQGQRILSFGGSLGATAVNRAVLDMMAGEYPADTAHLHATGKREYEAFLSEFKARELHRRQGLRVVPFLSDMPQQMAAADVVVCRAGAMSISELAAAGRAAVLIPSPNVTNNHQFKNAKTLSDKGACLLLEERDLTGERLSREVFSLLSGKRREAFERAIATFHRPDCRARILADIHEIVKRRG